MTFIIIDMLYNHVTSKEQITRNIVMLKLYLTQHFITGFLQQYYIII